MHKIARIQSDVDFIFCLCRLHIAVDWVALFVLQHVIVAFSPKSFSFFCGPFS